MIQSWLDDVALRIGKKLDRLVQVKCHGEAWRRAQTGESIASIVGEIRALVGDRRHVSYRLRALGSARGR